MPGYGPVGKWPVASLPAASGTNVTATIAVTLAAPGIAVAAGSGPSVSVVSTTVKPTAVFSATVTTPTTGTISVTMASPTALVQGATYSVTVTLITTTGSSSWTVPSDASTITVEVWGAGGQGELNTSTAPFGGGGGGYAKRTFTVTPGDVIPYIIPSGTGGSATKFGDSTFGTGGTFYVGASSGLDGATTTPSRAAGGGPLGTYDVGYTGSPGVSSPLADGGNSATSSGNGPVQNGSTTGVSNVEGGYGGKGVDLANFQASTDGGAPGGGGGGSPHSSWAVSNPGRGQIRITYSNQPATPIGTITATSTKPAGSLTGSVGTGSTIAITAVAPTAAASATVTNPASGTIAITVVVPTAALVGGQGMTALIAATSPVPTASATGNHAPYMGSIAATTAMPTAEVNAGHGISGSVAASPARPTALVFAGPLPAATIAATTSMPTVFAVLAKQEAEILSATAGATGTWTVPAGITTLKVQLWGAGGGGNIDGGGGGAYAELANLTVTPGQVFSYSTGVGGNGYGDFMVGGTNNRGGTNGGDTWFNSSTYLKAGGGGGARLSNLGATINNGIGGVASGSVSGWTGFSGRNGGLYNTTTLAGGGGGSSGSPNGLGTVASGTIGGSANGGGAGGDPSINSGNASNNTVGGGGGAGQSAIISGTPGTMFGGRNEQAQGFYDPTQTAGDDSTWVCNYSRGATPGGGGGGSHKNQPVYNPTNNNVDNSFTGTGADGGDGQAVVYYFRTPTVAQVNVPIPAIEALLNAALGVASTLTVTVASPATAVSGNHIAYPAAATATLARPTPAVTAGHGIGGPLAVTLVAPSASMAARLVPQGVVAATTPQPITNIVLLGQVPNGSSAAIVPFPGAAATVGHGVAGSASATTPQPIASGYAAWATRRTTFQGAMAETIVVRRPLTVDEREKMEGYLAWKWHTQASLHPLHPYRWNPPGFTTPPRYIAMSAINVRPAVSASATRHQAIAAHMVNPAAVMNGQHGIGVTMVATLAQPSTEVVSLAGQAMTASATTVRPTGSMAATHKIGLVGQAVAPAPTAAMAGNNYFTGQMASTAARPVFTGQWNYISLRTATSSATLGIPTAAVSSTHIAPRTATSSATMPKPTAAVREGDPFWFQTELFLRFQTQISGVYKNVDSSSTPKTMSSNGITYGTAFSPYGEAGGHCARAPDRNTGGITVDGTSRFNVGTGDFTWEMWLIPIDSFYATPSAAKALDQYLIHNVSQTFEMKMLDTGELSVTGLGTLTGTNIWDTANWVHVAISRASGTLRAFINGTQVGSATYTDSVHFTGTDTGYSYLLRHATDADLSLNYAYVDDIRFTTAARYTSSFAKPTVSPPAH